MTQIWQIHEVRTAKSAITGRPVAINLSADRILISPFWKRDRAFEAIREWQGHCDEARAARRPTAGMLSAVDQMATALDQEEFGAALHHLIVDEFLPQRENLENAAHRMVDLLVRLWSHACIAWPASHKFLGGRRLWLTTEMWGWGDRQKLVVDFDTALKGDSYVTRKRRLRCFLETILTFSGVQGAADITPEILQVDRDDRESGWPRILKTLLALQRESHPAMAPIAFSEFGWTPKEAPRYDAEFKWVVDKDPAMEAWRAEGAAFLAERQTNFGKSTAFLNKFFDHLVGHFSLPRNPVEYFSLHNPPHPPFPATAESYHERQALFVLREFFEFVLDRHCVVEDDHGHPARLPGFANPLKGKLKRGFRRSHAETHREPMPTRFVRLAIDILLENDFAWAKETTNTPAFGDRFRWRDPTGAYRDLWSPVRTYALLIKLLLPLRTFQMRMLDSGEADSFVFRPASGGWLRNRSPLAPKSRKPLQRGVFRRYTRRDGTEGSLIFVNTNKTADIDVEPDKRGFVMAWEHEQAIMLMAQLRDWQERHNPLACPTPFGDVPELQSARSPDELQAMGNACFLFRDPTAEQRPDLPITDGRVRYLWWKLMEELQDRLNEAGERMPNGEPYQFVWRDANGKITRALFDLHTLRVTAITALYEEGGVPPEILMKIVGHATVLMTLYYTKISHHRVTEVLDEGRAAVLRSEQRNWVGWLKRKNAPDLSAFAAWNHQSGLTAFAESSGGGAVIMDHGFCPVGARRCGEGLAVTDVETGKSVVKPVPGGSSNCVRCRFFLSGPSFLVGLEALVTDLSYRLKNKSRSFIEAQTKFDELEDSFKAALEAGEPFYRNRDLEIAESALENATATVDELALSLQAAYRLAEQCRIINQRRRQAAQDGSFALVAPGGVDEVELVLEETHPFEQVHRLCRAATLFDGLKIDWRQANLERMRFFDRMLAASGHAPVFTFIDSEEEALRVGTEMGNFLFARLNRDDLGALMDGRTTMRALGLDYDFAERLECLAPRTLRISASAPMIEATTVGAA